MNARTADHPARDAAAPSGPAAPVAASQPNEFDRRRIERSLTDRKRYRYVSPRVQPVAGGYLVRSPCCSRNVDADGGEVDIALLQTGPAPCPWLLYRKDHAHREWRLHGSYGRLAELLAHLNSDPQRRFWQ
jgi:hypothetical protein